MLSTRRTKGWHGQRGRAHCTMMMDVELWRVPISMRCGLCSAGRACLSAVRGVPAVRPLTALSITYHLSLTAYSDGNDGLQLYYNTK